MKMRIKALVDGPVNKWVTLNIIGEAPKNRPYMNIDDDENGKLIISIDTKQMDRLCAAWRKANP